MFRTSSRHEIEVHWNKWMRIVKSIESRRTFTTSSRRYALLYEQLMKVCRCDSNSTTLIPGSSRRLQRSIKRIVQPWVSLESLRRADRKILDDLIRQCREVDRVMHPHVIHIPSFAIKAFVVMAVVVSMILAFYLTSSESSLIGWYESLLERMQRRSRLILTQTTLSQWLLVVTALVMLFGITLTRGARKS